ncbi:MAG: class I SAM-dependent methyltransferase, partial [Acidimicrobiales bacterium]|nr:class I SAM-dependent methyltransferase [Acidimicrobiales bacterium]
RHYLRFVEGREFLVELGAGRGEFLELAAPTVGRVLGVDADPVMVEQIKAKGLEATQAEVGEYVAATDDRPDAVFLAHLIEHLPVDTAFALLCNIASILRPGGVVIVVTPNPACLANLTNDFWSDPTHVRLYTLELLSFLCEQAGFEVIEASGNPADVPGPPPLLRGPDPLGPWARPEPQIEPRGPVQYDEHLHLESVIEELARLRVGVESLAHWIIEQSRQLIELRHYAEVLARHYDATLEHLWGPNEIYVVGERRE